jgi:shikimate kinase
VLLSICRRITIDPAYIKQPSAIDMNKNVILTGFMGTGKTVVGRLLATALGYQFVDTDAMIESRYGPINEIFAESGEAAFRRAEGDIADELSGVEGHVIATGGRLLLDERNLAVLGERSRIFCLVASPEELVTRLGDSNDRPLLAGANRLRRIVDLLAERQAQYDRFEQIETDGRSPEEVSAAILERL